MRCCEKSVDNTQTALSEVNGKVNKMLLKCIVVKCSREQEIDNITFAITPPLQKFMKKLSFVFCLHILHPNLK